MSWVRSIMKRQLVVAQSGESVATSVRRMTEHNLGALLIVEDGKLAGLFTERDLMKRVVAAGLDVDTTRVGDVATANPASVRPDTTLKECGKVIRELNIRHLPVTDDAGKAVGIISSRDLLQVVVEGLESFIEKTFLDRHSEEMTDPYDSFVDDFDS